MGIFALGLNTARQRRGFAAAFAHLDAEEREAGTASSTDGGAHPHIALFVFVTEQFLVLLPGGFANDLSAFFEHRFRYGLSQIEGFVELPFRSKAVRAG